MGYLTKAMIDGAEDRKTVDYDVPEWGGTARLMVLSGKDLDTFEQILQDPTKHNDAGVRARLVGMCLVDESNKRVYSDADLRLLGKKSGQVLTKIFRKCVELNKIDKADEEELAEEVENFDETNGDTSTSD